MSSPIVLLPTFSISIRASRFSVPLSSLVLEMAGTSMALGTDVSAMIAARLDSVRIEFSGGSGLRNGLVVVVEKLGIFSLLSAQEEENNTPPCWRCF